MNAGIMRKALNTSPHHGTSAKDNSIDGLDVWVA